MNIELTSLGVQILVALATGMGVYAGIRADLSIALERSKHAMNSSRDAHDRLDDHIDKHHTK